MGAGNKLDPTQIRIGSIWESRICPLAKLVRKKLRTRGFTGDCQCVYSLEEPLDIRHTSSRDGTHVCICGDEVRGDEELASEAGFSGVPTYVIDGKLAIPGAQPPDVLVRLLGRMAAGQPIDD